MSNTIAVAADYKQNPFTLVYDGSITVVLRFCSGAPCSPQHLRGVTH
jgi:hypothetical protein